MAGPPLIGALALQGGFEAHERMLQGLGAATRQVRKPADLEQLDGLVIPGGESTTMTLGIEREQLAGPLRGLAAAGVPVLGSCAGLIMLDRDHLGVMDIRAPWITEHGPGVEVLATLEGHPVAAREGSLVAVSFHAELGEDDRLHRSFLELVRARVRAPAPSPDRIGA